MLLTKKMFTDNWLRAFVMRMTKRLFNIDLLTSWCKVINVK